MTVLCGTDFSTHAAHAVDAASWIARVRQTRLHLVHVLDIPGADEVLAQDAQARVTAFFRAERARLEERLREEAQRIADRGVHVDVEVLAGPADEAIVSRAKSLSAELVVVGAVGRRGDSWWRLGRTSDRIAQSSPAPVLVVRDDGPFRAWAQGERALRVVVGIDPKHTSDAALAWVRELASTAPVEASAVHVYWPPETPERMRAETAAQTEPETQSRMKAELQSHIQRIAGGVTMLLRLVGGLGRPADHLLQILAAEKADLLALGCHRRRGVMRLWHGSVSRDLILHAPTNVVVVPFAPEGEDSA